MKPLLKRGERRRKVNKLNSPGFHITTKLLQDRTIFLYFIQYVLLLYEPVYVIDMSKC